MSSHVDSAERDRRERKLGTAVGGVMAAFLLGVPLIGWVGALFVSVRMCSKAFINSSSRALDIGLSLLGLLIYWAIAFFAVATKNYFLACLLPALWGAAWMWMAQKRFSFFD